ncbi:restriction endonuclease subunit S [Leptospirillum ferrooxidans]|uniref:Putative restriction modification system DNA specificity domain n=1 Tax=Leptospirillum ferrooxidans (strain C2-3) TaxID=1162668 RepID=I0ILC6_LEPFC|nr:restriction endonuclease subunit S [Leptospirillum ferrooxidans]BAM06075.1 putative restriction modification system DNA specificity domain [Leptospirillum ferrooxidans C2-3]
MPLDIRPDHLEIVLEILNRVIPGREVWAFGSRATWTARDTSDLDLAVIGETSLDFKTLAALRDAFSESNIPYKVDVVDWANISETFREIIRKDKVVIQKRIVNGAGYKNRYEGLQGSNPLEEWISCKLCEACRSIDYGLTASAVDTPVGPRFLRITDIVSGEVNWKSVPYVSVNECSAHKYRLDSGDIVIARTGASTGASAYINNPPPAVFASYLVRLKAKPEFDSRFLAYYLRSNDFWSFIRGVLGDKSAQPNASAWTMTQAPLKAPRDKNIQRAIAHILGTLDDKIELNRRMNETLEAMAQALFKSWFVDFDPVRAKVEGRPTGLPKEIEDLFPDSFEDSELGEIPRGWKLTTLSSVINIFDSKRVPLSSNERAKHKGKYPYYGATGILDYVDHYLFEGVHILVGEDGSVINNKDQTPVTQYVWGKFWVSNHAHVLTGKQGVSSEHLLLFLQQADIGSFVTGAVQPKLNQSNLCQIPFVMSPMLLAEAFGKIVSRFYSFVRRNSEEVLSLTQLRDTLLPKLLSGEIRVSNAGRFF